MLNKIIDRWRSFTSGQRKTVWLLSLLSPVLPCFLIWLQGLLTPELEKFIGYKEVIVAGLLLSFGPIAVISYLAKQTKS